MKRSFNCIYFGDVRLKDNQGDAYYSDYFDCYIFTSRIGEVVYTHTHELSFL